MRPTSKGQITIPRRLREKFGIGPHTEIDVVEDGNTLRILKKGPGRHHVEGVYGLLHHPQSTDRLIERIRGR